MFGALPSKVTVVEVGPRDGLQAEPDVIPTAAKIAYIDRLSEAGYAHVEATSFVNPAWVPQLADAREVAAGISRRPGTVYSALVPNMRGLEGALAAGMDEIVLFVASSETFSQKNTNRSIAQSLVVSREVAAAALAAGKRVRAYVSTVWACPYEGRMSPEATRPVAEALLEMGAYQVSLGDTNGMATPGRVQETLAALSLPVGKLALHFHDTRGMGMANVLAGLEMGVTTFDASSGGLGGCPYAPGATGNIATEDLLFMLGEMGIETGVSLDRVVEASRFMAATLGRELPGRYLKARLTELSNAPRC